ncbi:hypothetical protein [Methylobacterium isbiliense]|jgi:hypothetical protein|uniref:Uncharacterized protein n=1 Tax=Methylobacterium isbiliense TaxID=315478 RepID=A0ABQ4SAQ8_9HYPH|nr:hypothetical protein [Methylobacterium isbiliense]MDN3621927.1 hypothetical protein [Methylobacterium isbiliense]GJD99559.1 hypothetical protein GMJLKIPL_1477 [Methylobacterium isbiliense]
MGPARAMLMGAMLAAAAVAAVAADGRLAPASAPSVQAPSPADPCTRAAWPYRPQVCAAGLERRPVRVIGAAPLRTTAHLAER